ncbi:MULTISPECIES: glutathione S-transferase family protein [unclassified Mesorhizobium]|uniref:glutathione S-transferase family protein n=1 Tax=unclassified Mesorhizobium TaxID=325217 RepID=UPI000F74CCAA|nr:MULTISPECIES: glutathione S-transferase family protein [unclassified Mesorhizobium]TGV91743.1 glutathione S-transferase family protein [Mesorhizobium sp. M00.F.Ca.ET.158.01.1.1]AZO58824.1 glutathione S-transferase family protein [Mesorhizobium sp. M1A.F.Ca.IN.022.06.1.1]MCT2578951.1 glutathione S-transferase family protein [Mesorhizobium sp. P13.3]MDF3167891.1 glutathione S-transferase family protein [Mesorhizobium sp. P16.1]MDF3178225.1 glutathione S-transferase family protein [Mesorhizobi
MYQLYIGNKNYSSWSLRPWLLMRTLDIRFEERLTPFPTGSSFSLFRSFSPNGRVPCLVDDGWAVWDSLSIVEYLAERHRGVWPADAKARAWARSAAAEMHSSFTALRNDCPMSCGVRVKLASMSDALKHDLFRLGDLWNDGLARFGGPFLAGDHFTAVDAFFAPVVFRAQSYGLAFEGAAAAYPKRLLDLPAMREWYAAGLAETWREPDHEAEVRAAGTVVEDLRASA